MEASVSSSQRREEISFWYRSNPQLSEDLSAADTAPGRCWRCRRRAGCDGIGPGGEGDYIKLTESVNIVAHTRKLVGSRALLGRSILRGMATTSLI